MALDLAAKPSTPAVPTPTNILAQYGIDTITNTDLQDTLAGFVRKKFMEAETHKRSIGINQKLLRNLRAHRSEYQPDEIDLLGAGNNIYIGISALKARAAESWILDIILSNIDKPWTLSATTLPDLPESVKEEVVDILLKELPAIPDISALRERAKMLKDTAYAFTKQKADKGAKQMELLITDQLEEGDWYTCFQKFVSDITVYPTAIMRGPVVVSSQQAYWDGDTYAVKCKDRPTVKVISPFDAFPSPSSTTAGDGEYFIERARMGMADLHSTINSKGFDSVNVRKVINDYPDGYSINMTEDTQRDYLEDKNQGILGPNNHNMIDTLIYNGVVPGSLLADKGLLVEDPQKYYECEVWVVNDCVIRAVLNPNPSGTRPVFSTSYVKANDGFWGKSVIDLTYDTMRVCNSSARSIVRNMGYSSGPIGEVVGDRLAPGENINELIPYKIFNVGPDLTGTGQPAFKFHNVDAVVDKLMGIFQYFMKLADDLSGIPAYVLGNPQVAGAGRTLGGLSMLMANAAKGIKNVQLNIDRDVIGPLVTNFYVYNMQVATDPTIKADAKVIVRGATGLLQRELAQSRITEILQLLTPYVQMGILPKEAIQYILREVLKGTGIDVDKVIPNPGQTEEIQDVLARLMQGEALDRGTGTPQALPPQSQPNMKPIIPSGPVNMPIG